MKSPSFSVPLMTLHLFLRVVFVFLAFWPYFLVVDNSLCCIFTTSLFICQFFLSICLFFTCCVCFSLEYWPSLLAADNNLCCTFTTSSFLCLLKKTNHCYVCVAFFPLASFFACCVCRPLLACG